MLGFKAFDTAQSTLVGIELMHMIKKRQMVVEEESREMLGVMPLPGSPRPQGPCPDTSA